MKRRTRSYRRWAGHSDVAAAVCECLEMRRLLTTYTLVTEGHDDIISYTQNDARLSLLE